MSSFQWERSTKNGDIGVGSRFGRLSMLGQDPNSGLQPNVFPQLDRPDTALRRPFIARAVLSLLAYLGLVSISPFS